MPLIKPISDLRNHFSSISDLVHNQDEPVFLTKNGHGDMVVMSVEHYEKQIAKIELYSKLQEARDEIQEGATGKNAQDVLLGLMDK